MQPSPAVAVAAVVKGPNLLTDDSVFLFHPACLPSMNREDRDGRPGNARRKARRSAEAQRAAHRERPEKQGRGRRRRRLSRKDPATHRRRMLRGCRAGVAH